MVVLLAVLSSCGHAPPTRPLKDPAGTPSPRVDITDLLVDAAGTIWVVEHVDCPRGEGGSGFRAWLSQDLGVTWLEAPIATDYGEHPLPPLSWMAADARRGGHLLVYTRPCKTGRGMVGGSVFLTRNGGESWTILELPPELERNEDEEQEPFARGQLIGEIYSPGNNLDHLEFIEWGAEEWWRTLDGGHSWELIEEDLGPPTAAPPRPTVVSECEFQGMDTRILRRCRGEEELSVVFPYPGLRLTPEEEMRAAAGRVRAAELVEAVDEEALKIPAGTLGRRHVRVLATLSDDEVSRINQILSRFGAADGWVATTPPWDAALLLDLEGGKLLALHFVGTALRMSRLQPLEGGAWATCQLWTANSGELNMRYEDERWLWSLFRKHLGPTRVKEYQPFKLPGAWLKEDGR